VLLLQLIDLFANLWRYLAYDAAALDIMRVALYYVPKSVSYALPISLLFAARTRSATCMPAKRADHNLRHRNSSEEIGAELVGHRCAMSFGSFYFEDQVVIRFQRMKNDLSQTLLRPTKSATRVRYSGEGGGGRLVYSVDYYNDKETTLNGISIVEGPPIGAFLRLIKSRQAPLGERRLVTG
jgi:lipopolysaccharide export system permease protein